MLTAWGCLRRKALQLPKTKDHTTKFCSLVAACAFFYYLCTPGDALAESLSTSKQAELWHLAHNYRVFEGSGLLVYRQSHYMLYRWGNEGGEKKGDEREKLAIEGQFVFTVEGNLRASIKH